VSDGLEALQFKRIWQEEPKCDYILGGAADVKRTNYTSNVVHATVRMPGNFGHYEPRRGVTGCSLSGFFFGEMEPRIKSTLEPGSTRRSFDDAVLQSSLLIRWKRDSCYLAAMPRRAYPVPRRGSEELWEMNSGRITSTVGYLSRSLGVHITTRDDRHCLHLSVIIKIT
jgi:hypothetical protein